MADVKAETQATNGHTTNGHTNGHTNGTSENINGTSDKSHYNLPDAKTVQEAGELPLKDEHSKGILFKSLYEGQAGRQLIIFIRHFYCGHCEEYVRYLSKHLSVEKLAALPTPTTLTIIGHGDTICIPDYRTRTGCPYPIYTTDRSYDLYQKLGMVVSLGSGGDTASPEYLTKSVTSSVVSSFKNIVFSGSKGLKGGKYDQNGGEWVFENGECKWVRRMRGTADHTLIEELNGVLGI